MKLYAVESIGELVALVGSALGTVFFTVAGVIVDNAGVHNLVAGQVSLGAWELWIGTTAIVVGLYLFGYREFWPRLQQIQHTD